VLASNIHVLLARLSQLTMACSSLALASPSPTPSSLSSSSSCSASLLKEQEQRQVELKLQSMRLLTRISDVLHLIISKPGPIYLQHSNFSLILQLLHSIGSSANTCITLRLHSCRNRNKSNDESNNENENENESEMGKRNGTSNSNGNGNVGNRNNDSIEEREGEGEGLSSTSQHIVLESELFLSFTRCIHACVKNRIQLLPPHLPQYLQTVKLALHTLILFTELSMHTSHFSSSSPMHSLSLSSSLSLPLSSSISSSSTSLSSSTPHNPYPLLLCEALSRIYEAMGQPRTKKVLSKYLVYLLHDYIKASAVQALPPLEKRALLVGIYTVMGACSEFEFKQLHALLNMAGKSLFKILYGKFVKGFKYTGKV
jgi:hypothetical protein